MESVQKGIQLLTVSTCSAFILYGLYLASKKKKDRKSVIPLVASAPGKVILFGEHAVVYQKMAVAGSLGLRVFTLIEEIFDGRNGISLELLHFGIDFHFTKNELSNLYQHSWISNLDRNQPSNMDPSLTKEFISALNHLILSKAPEKGQDAVLIFFFLFYVISSASTQLKDKHIRISARSHLPVGMGLGSSGAYAVSLVTALTSAYGVRACSARCLDCNNRKLCSLQKEFINNWAFQAEVISHGTPSGLDNTVSTFGGVMSFQRGPPISITKLDKIPSIRFLLTNTKVQRKTKDLVEKVRQFWRNNTESGDKIFDEIDHISRTCYNLFISTTGKELTNKIEELVDKNQALLDQIGVSHPSLDKVCEVTRRYGLHSKLTGAGGGGCALTVLPNEVSQTIIQQVQKSLTEEGFECFVVEIGGSGASIHCKSEVNIF